MNYIVLDFIQNILKHISESNLVLKIIPVKEEERKSAGSNLNVYDSLGILINKVIKC